MSETPVTPSAPEASPTQDQPTDFDIGEEYGTARKNLPPAKIVAICVAVVAAITAVYALTHRAHARSTGTIEEVVAVPMPGEDMVMVAVNLSVQNRELKPAWIKSIQLAADVGGNKLSDDAAPAVDVQRYFQAMPDLKQHALNLLTPETRIDPGARIQGTVVASFPVKADAFAARKSLTVIITPYDELPVVITR
ncbi:MAG: hypothetical protein JO356_09535 [Acidobacteria bacterium]|nr:hypothetical protein [Acidobacteriota bacterium]